VNVLSLNTHQLCYIESIINVKHKKLADVSETPGEFIDANIDIHQTEDVIMVGKQSANGDIDVHQNTDVICMDTNQLVSQQENLQSHIDNSSNQPEASRPQTRSRKQTEKGELYRREMLQKLFRN